MKRWFRSGRPWVWLTASSISISLLAMLAIIVLLAGQGMRYLWPQPVWLLTLQPEQGVQRALMGRFMPNRHFHLSNWNRLI